VVIKYRRPVVKLKKSQALVCAAAPAGVIDGSRADVSFVAGLLIDKFAYHLPLYRQHQRLTDAGITVSRPWLTQIAQQGIGPARTDLRGAVRLDSRVARQGHGRDADQGRVRRVPGKLKAGYFWPVYGERDEICFPFFESREIKHVEAALGLTPVERRSCCRMATTPMPTTRQDRDHACPVLGAYPPRLLRGAGRRTGSRRAGAGADRRAVRDRRTHPRRPKLAASKKRLSSWTHAKPIVERFFAWIDERFEAQGLLPSNPLTKALAYARDRRGGLEVYLTDPDVPIDTNHLERALRVIPMGRRNWMFCWTELGAKHVGILQSLIVTCRLHQIDPTTTWSTFCAPGWIR
jgi:transposase